MLPLRPIKTAGCECANPEKKVKAVSRRFSLNCENVGSCCHCTYLNNISLGNTIYVSYIGNNITQRKSIKARICRATHMGEQNR